MNVLRFAETKIQNTKQKIQTRQIIRVELLLSTARQTVD